MAADAFKSLEKRMDAAKEAELAAYIMRDVELRQQKAEEMGVLAYGRKPVPRGRPNERFLQNTLKSVSYANRRLAEDEMWQQWNSRKRSRHEDDRSKRRSASPAEPRRRSPEYSRRSNSRRSESESESASDSEQPSSSEDEGATARAEQDFTEMLATRTVRGRGSTGPRADDVGPYLFPTDEQEKEEYELLRYSKPAAQGAICPDWIRAQHAESPPKVLDDGTRVHKTASLKAKRKRKKEKKEKKKAKKAKKEKKRKRRSASSD